MNKNSLLLWSAGALMGAMGGFAYYYFIGCESGSCAITSRPINSSLYGALMGGLLISMFEKKKGDKDVK